MSLASSILPLFDIRVTVNPGQQASFNVVASGTAPLTYQWNKNAIAITGATGSTYTIASVVSTDAGNYTITVTNSAGSVTSSVATLTVNSTYGNIALNRPYTLDPMPNYPGDYPGSPPESGCNHSTDLTDLTDGLHAPDTAIICDKESVAWRPGRESAFGPRGTWKSTLKPTGCIGR